MRIYILAVLIVVLSCGRWEYDNSVPYKCRAFENDIVVDKFSNDTLKVIALGWSSKNGYRYMGRIHARSKNHRTVELHCGEYKIISRASTN